MIKLSIIENGLKELRISMEFDRLGGKKKLNKNLK